MKKGNLYIYTGEGKGKSRAAIGRAMQVAMAGGRVVLVQFLKGKGPENSEFLRRLEPELKVFCFEKKHTVGGGEVRKHGRGLVGITGVTPLRLALFSGMC